MSAAPSRSFRLALAGEAMVVRPFSMHAEEEFMDIVNIMRSSDIGFLHLEMLLHDYESPPGKGDWTGGYFRAEPRVAGELRWAGVNLVSAAHNHCKDFGDQGVLSTMEHLDSAGIVHAGMGKDLEEAREPAYLETRSGRVALISVASGIQPHERASLAKGPLRGRPGCNYLRFTARYIVDPGLIERLRELGAKLGLRERIKVGEGEVAFLGNIFAPGSEPSIVTTPHPWDLEANLRAVRDARRQADLVLVSHHCHAPTVNRDNPPTLIPVFAKGCIDAGADAYIGSGAHRDLGIEIYKGRPIFYSIGNFFAQSEFLERTPPEAYEAYGLEMDRLSSLTSADYHDSRIGTLPQPGPLWWSTFIAQLGMAGGRVTELRLHPVTTGREGEGGEIHARPTGARTEGRPLMARGATGSRILNRLKNLSEPYGTHIEIRKGVGLVKIS